MARRLVNALAVAASLLILVASLGGYVVVKWFDGSIARIHLDLGQQRPPEVAGSQNWLLVGTDAGRANVPGQRSDTTILSHLDADGTTTNLSIPRDTLVRIPAYTDSKGHPHPSQMNKFNSAILVGGPSLLVRTVEALTNMRVDHYISVDLAGFRRISNALGGVTVCILHSNAPPDVETENGITHVSTNIDDSFSNFHGHDGKQTIIGDQALAFVRQRHGLPGSDLSRIQRQQQFLGSVFRQATSTGVLLNPIRVTQLLSALKDALTLSDNTSLADLETLATRLRGEDPSKIQFEIAPTRDLTSADTDLGTLTGNPKVPSLTPKGQTQDVGNVQILDQTGFDAMLARLNGNNAPNTDTSGPSRAAKSRVHVTVPPQQVLVTVENGNGRSGIASTVTEALASNQFRTGPPGPADSTRYAQSEVHYSPGSEGSAKTVAAAVPGSVLRADAGVTTGVVLIVGANYTGVLPVTVNGEAAPATPTPTPTASASPVAPPVTAASAANRCTL